MEKKECIKWYQIYWDPGGHVSIMFTYFLMKHYAKGIDIDGKIVPI